MKKIIDILSKNMITLIVSILLLLSVLANIWFVHNDWNYQRLYNDRASKRDRISKIPVNNLKEYSYSFSQDSNNGQPTSYHFSVVCNNGECVTSTSTKIMSEEEIRQMHENIERQRLEMQKRIDEMDRFWRNYRFPW